MRKVCVVAATQTKFGVMKETAREAAADVSLAAIHQAGITPKDIQAIYVGNCFGVSESQAHIGPLVSTALGIPDRPTLTIESACATGSVTFREAYMGIAGGFYDIALAVGTEKVSHLDVLTATSYFAMGSDYSYEGRNGVSFPGLYALMATAYLHKYGATQEQLAAIAVKNHANAANNPKAHFQKAITVEEVMKSRPVAWPLKLYDCCPFSDGAAAAVLMSEEAARKLSTDRIYVLGSGRGGMTAALHDRKDLTRMESARRAAEAAYLMAGLKPANVDFAEVHDCFTVAEAIATEELGFFPYGEGANQAAEGATAIGGDIPVNPSGGLKAKGHPVGATGLGQICEVWDQLREKAGPRQVKGAEVGLTHNVGATGGSAAVHLFAR